MKSQLFYFAMAAAAAVTPLHGFAASTSVIASTDDARRLAYTMHASGQSADIPRMLSEFTPRTTDEARALAGLRIEFAAKAPLARPRIAAPTTTDEARAVFMRQA